MSMSMIEMRFQNIFGRGCIFWDLEALEFWAQVRKNEITRWSHTLSVIYLKVVWIFLKGLLTRFKSDIKSIFTDIMWRHYYACNYYKKLDILGPKLPPFLTEFYKNRLIGGKYANFVENTQNVRSLKFVQYLFFWLWNMENLKICHIGGLTKRG